MLIDCGYADTVKAYLKNDLIRIGEEGGILEKLILTHIDVSTPPSTSYKPIIRTLVAAV